MSLHLFYSVNFQPGYDIKQSDSEALGMLSIPSLPLLSGPLWPRVVAPNRVLCMGQIELFDIQTVKTN